MLFLAVSPESFLPEGTDKAVHFAAFTILALLLLAIVPKWYAAVAITFFLAVLSESIQAPLPAREADIYDLLADTAGIAVGAALFLAVRWMRRWAS